jgi:hyperosmotically inducible protein
MVKKENDDILAGRVSRLENDKDLQGYGLQTDAVEGEVQIQGVVDTLQEKERAEKLAAQTPGVKGVGSGISISTDGSITDKDVLKEVNEELQIAGVDLHDIGAQTRGGHGKVVLKGRTDDPAQVEDAIKAAAKARGVTEVFNQVKQGEKKLTLTDIFHGQVRNDEKDLNPEQ